MIPADRVKDAQAELLSAGIESGIAGSFADGEKLTLRTDEELWGILARV